MTAVLKAGFGYWDVTTYPKGGCFKRAKERTPVTIKEVTETYSDGKPREYLVAINGTETACVGSDALEVSE